jgi:HEAT repeat protein
LQGKSSAERSQAEEAVRRTSTNGLPVLRRLLRAHDSALKVDLLRLLWQQDRIRFRVMLARAWNVRAALACGVLGAEAQPLIPDLLVMAKGDFVQFEVAVSALSQIGMVAVPHLVKGLTNESVRIRQASARALGAIGSEARDSVGVLVKSLHDPDAQVRINASSSLGAIGHGSPEVVNALAAALSDPNRDVRDNVVDALGQLGLQAKSAFPALLKMLSDPDDLVRSDVTNVLDALPPTEITPPEKSKEGR